MRSKSMKLALASLLLCVGQMSSAQVLQVIGCEVERADAFQEMIGEVFDATSGGYRPTITLVANQLNGPNEQTHAVLLDHPDYESFGMWAQQVGGNSAAQLAFERGLGGQECESQLLVIERASWGDRDGEWAWNAIFPVTTSDSEAYADALDDLMTSDTGSSLPGATVLYEARAGGTNSHTVAVLAPSFAALNTALDTLFGSEDFADFVDDVEEIRSIGPRSQGRRVQTWEP